MCKETEHTLRCNLPADPKGKGYCRIHAVARFILSPDGSRRKEPVSECAGRTFFGYGPPCRRLTRDVYCPQHSSQG